MESASNTVTGAVSGVDIALVKEGKANLALTSNSDTLKTSVQTFVNAYNALMTTINAQTKVTTGLMALPRALPHLLATRPCAPWLAPSVAKSLAA